MSTALSVYHGTFGRACLYHMNRPMIRHAHREGHLTFLLEGLSGKQEIAGKFYDLSPEAGTAINSWEPHDFRPGDPVDGSLLLVLYIQPMWFMEVGGRDTTALRFGRTRIEITDHIARSMGKVVSLLMDSYADPRFDGYLYEFTKECFDQTWQLQPKLAVTQKASLAYTDFRIRKSIQLMANRLGSEILLDDVARESGLSRPHFYKLFREQIGITPNLYWNTLRMERAIDQLTQTEMSVTDIGTRLGFSCQSGFTRFFCSNVGMAPTDYRRVAHVMRR